MPRSLRILALAAIAGLLLTAELHVPASLAGRAPEVVPGAASLLPRAPAGVTSAIRQTSWIPFDPPPTLVLPTTAGTLTIAGGQPAGESTVLLGNEHLSSMSAALWAADPARMLAVSPRDVRFVFLSYAPTAEVVQADIHAMQAKVEAALSAVTDVGARAHWLSHISYVPVNPLSLDGGVRDLLRDWGDTYARVTATWTEGGEARSLSTIGTTDDRWARSLHETGPITGTVALYGNLACGEDGPTVPITGTVALIERGVCNFAEKAGNALRHGADAVLIYTTPNRPLVTMPGTCTECPKIPIAMVDNPTGLAIRDKVAASVPVTVALQAIEGGAEALAVDRAGRLRAFGSIPYPFNADLGADALDPLQSVAYEATYLQYEHERDARLAAEEAAGARVIPLLVGEWVSDPDWAGQRAFVEVALPDAATMATYDTLELDLTLGCQDHWRNNCPSWDYIANLYLCDANTPDRCDLEVGRWITPYWAEGRWVTDVTPLLALLSDGGARRFAFYTQQRYQVDLDLRLSNRKKGIVPKRAYDIGLNGGAFWKDYNALFHPVDFVVPDWAGKVEVMSVISGHGFGHDAENCAEFCNHTHHFTVNGQTLPGKTHPMAGTLLGCAEQVADGVVPNQGGTWIYGRGGWCPGLEVKPWVVDITSSVRRDDFNELVYRGLFGGKDYVAVKGEGQDPAAGFDARIDMRSFLVFWGPPEVQPGPFVAPYPRVPATLFLPRSLADFDR